MVHLITDQGEHLETYETIRLGDLAAAIQGKGYHVEDVELRELSNELFIICKKRRCRK